MAGGICVAIVSFIKKVGVEFLRWKLTSMDFVMVFLRMKINLILEVLMGNIIAGSFSVILLLFVLAGGMWGCPQYKVYSQRMDGESQLAHAQASKEVAVAEAKAKMESASHLANAEIARARGVAEANKIIGESLTGNDAYLKYLWITEVAGKDVDKTVVYIPTETNIPIMEAGRGTKIPYPTPVK